jgi:hypothetical protein
MDGEYASFHPMDNTASTAISTQSILKIKELLGRNDKNFEILDFKTLTSEQVS